MSQSKCFAMVLMINTSMHWYECAHINMFQYDDRLGYNQWEHKGYFLL